MSSLHDESVALEHDKNDPLAEWRDYFYFPSRRSIGGSGDEPAVYLCGNSLGLQPRGVRERLAQELDDWATYGVEGHFDAVTPWFSYHEIFRESAARLVGAQPGEAVLMNSLTVNLHLLMVSFYRPTKERYKILIEDSAFPSDRYAVQSQLEVHGFDPQTDMLVARPREGETTLRTEDVLELIEREGDQIALVMFSGVNYFTGQAFDMKSITAAGHAKGCRVGFDLAHAAGNLVLKLHDWDVDFAVWCNYKYLNSGPGAVAGAYVHERHGKNVSMPRFAGWWGNDPEQRFEVPDWFLAREGADGWQLSNPPIFALAPVRASLDLFDRVGMPALRTKAEKLTGYLESLIDALPTERYEIITPRTPADRGCQLSIRIREGARTVLDALKRAGAICDFRSPDVIRAAPVPLYNSYRDVWEFVQILSQVDQELG